MKLRQNYLPKSDYPGSFKIIKQQHGCIFDYIFSEAK